VNGGRVRKKSRVIAVAAAGAAVARCAKPSVQAGRARGIRGCAGRNAGTRARRRRLSLYEVARDQLERFLRHRNARHDGVRCGVLRVPNHAVYVLARARLFQFRKTGADTSPFTAELVAAETGKAIAEERLGFGLLKRR
jgi:hypothetical protein